MTTQIFSVYDSKAEAYLLPFFQMNAALAIRAFSTEAQNPQHAFCIHAADYTLFHIGSWDETLGQVTMNEAHINLGTALTFQKELTHA